MSRTTKDELDQLARMIEDALELPRRTYFVQGGNGGQRLFTRGGAKEVSPRLSSGDLADWMRAYLEGVVTTKTLAGAGR